MLKAYVQLLIKLLIKKTVVNFIYSIGGILGVTVPNFDVKIYPWIAIKRYWQNVIKGPAPLSNL